MAQAKQKFQLELGTKGHCFLCRLPTSPIRIKQERMNNNQESNEAAAASTTSTGSDSSSFIPPTTSLCLQDLCKNLKIDMGSIAKEFIKNPQLIEKIRLASTENESDLKVSLCEICGKITKRFSLLVQQWLRIPTEMDQCLEKICKRISNTEENQELIQSYVNLMDQDISSMILSEFIDNLRLEILKKCSEIRYSQPETVEGGSTAATEALRELFRFRSTANLQNSNPQQASCSGQCLHQQQHQQQPEIINLANTTSNSVSSIQISSTFSEPRRGSNLEDPSAPSNDESFEETFSFNQTGNNGQISSTSTSTTTTDSIPIPVVQFKQEAGAADDDEASSVLEHFHEISEAVNAQQDASSGSTSSCGFSFESVKSTSASSIAEAAAATAPPAPNDDNILIIFPIKDVPVPEEVTLSGESEVDENNEDNTTASNSTRIPPGPSTKAPVVIGKLNPNGNSSSSNTAIASKRPTTKPKRFKFQCKICSKIFPSKVEAKAHRRNEHPRESEVKQQQKQQQQQQLTNQPPAPQLLSTDEEYHAHASSTSGQDENLNLNELDTDVVDSTETAELTPSSSAPPEVENETANNISNTSQPPHAGSLNSTTVFRCRICKKGFPRAADIRVHRRQAHPEDANDIKPIPARPSSSLSSASSSFFDDFTIPTRTMYGRKVKPSSKVQDEIISAILYPKEEKSSNPSTSKASSRINNKIKTAATSTSAASAITSFVNPRDPSSSTKKFKCRLPSCPKLFNTKKVANQHYRRHHADVPKQPKPQQQQQQPSKELQQQRRKLFRSVKMGGHKRQRQHQQRPQQRKSNFYSSTFVYDETKKIFKCSWKDCSSEFSTKAGAYLHYRATHLKIRFTCQRCNQSYTKLWRLKLHARQCSKNSSAVEAKKAEMVQEQQQQPEEEDQEEMLTNGGNSPDPPSPDSEILNQSSSSSSSSGNQVRRRKLADRWSKYYLDEESGRYKCKFPKCNKDFKQQPSAHLHYQKIHVKRNIITRFKFKCQRCDKVYSYKTALRKHKRLCSGGVGGNGK